MTLSRRVFAHGKASKRHCSPECHDIYVNVELRQERREIGWRLGVAAGNQLRAGCRPRKSGMNAVDHHLDRLALARRHRAHFAFQIPTLRHGAAGARNPSADRNLLKAGYL